MKRTLKSALLGSLLAFAAVGIAHAQAEDFLDRARAAEINGDIVSATQLYQSAIIYGSAMVEPYIGIAEFYAGNAEPNLAEKYFDIALELDPANPTALKGLGMLDLAEGDVEGAQARHEILVEACAPQCPEAAELRDAIASHGSSAMAVH
jgi:cytochrome c-type biogenesis protein CcmH/NrfG